MSQGAAAPSLTRAKPLFFRQKQNFRAEPAAKKEEKNIFLYLLNGKKTEFITSGKIKCPKFGIFTNN